MKLWILLFFSIGALCGAAAIGHSAWDRYERNKEISEEVAELQRQADAMRAENDLLSDQIQYFSTKEFKERQAKEKLNMKREGEQVVSVSPIGREGVAVLESPNVLGEESERKESNIIKWWRYFFEADDPASRSSK